ncbi:MAG: holin family protein [Oscillospiraceae bacterium]
MDAVAVKNAVLCFFAAAGSVIANALGGWDSALRVLVAMMVADYVTGVLVALIWHKSNKTDDGTLSSKAGFKGLCKKGVIILIVWLAVLLDDAMGANYVRTAVILFFIGNEGLSLFENVGLMGMPYPAFLKKALQALRDKGDNGNKDE